MEYLLTLLIIYILTNSEFVSFLLLICNVS